ncbi:acyltransferase PapA5 [Bythopirellula polymerisocia]|uniref:Acyltransferase PapA5 n=2 Tax=Bythopirellula polymerisocia TaxID=2528003 RepID=A0A5C6CMR7_9BACT|nr:acyltransferase PapA5 [Bythopirellula polymerisocia]
MLIDDRPTHPMSFFLKLTLSGNCDSESLRAALSIALQRHPLLLATIEKGKKDSLYWTNVERKDVELKWFPFNDPIRAEPIDLFSECGMRLSARRLESKTELELQFHHSCCDAIGALQFIEDLLVAYAAAVENAPEPTLFRSIDEYDLRDRGRFGLSQWKLIKMLPTLTVGLLGALQFLMRQPVSIEPIEIEAATAELPHSFPTSHGQQFSDSETAGLLAAARDVGATVNDLLVRDLFLALGEFRKARKLGDGSEWLRISIPMNLRTQHFKRSSAANVVSMVFLDRRPQSFDDGLSLLNTIGHEMQEIKRKRLGLIFPLMLQFMRSLPGAVTRLQQMSEKQVCNATTVLSNLGKPLRDVPLPRSDEKIVAGEMTLERIEFLPPVRPYTSAALGVSTYAGRLDISIHYDSRAITAANARELLEVYVERLRNTAKQILQ